MGAHAFRQETPPLRVLLVEDNPREAREIARQLEENVEQRFDVLVLPLLTQALARSVADKIDIVLADLGRPGGCGEQMVDAMLATWLDIPVVALIEPSDRRAGVMAVQRGCQDYLVKGVTDATLLQRTVRNAIERNRAAKALRESEARFRTLVAVSPDAILLCDAGEVLFANPCAVTTFGAADVGDLEGLDPSRLFDKSDWCRLVVTILAPVTATGNLATIRQECRLFRLDGRAFDAEVTMAPIVHRDRPAFEMIVRDISERMLSERGRRLALAVFETTEAAILVTDGANDIVAVNPAFERVTGYRAEEVIGRNPRQLSSGRHDPSFYRDMWNALLASGHWRGDVWNRRKNGEVYVQRLTLSLIRDDEGQVVNHIGVFSDITDEKQAAEQILYRANFDALTGLPNRALLHDRLSQGLAKSARGTGGLGVLFIDLDGFKPVNDRFGHLAGDHVLTVLAKRLQSCVRESDTVARLGGDEFVVVLPDMAEPLDAERVATKILMRAREPFALGRPIHRVRVEVSIGIALFPQHGHGAEELLNVADKAMYTAKGAGGGRYCLVDGICLAGGCDPLF
jgi:diguanylate cyclase (GGDEF)-like protein/PAS domain S-box-containing protein